MRIPIPTLAMAAVGVALIGCGSSSDSTTTPPAPTTVSYKATLAGSSERPTPNTSTAQGSFTGTLDLKTNILTYTVTYSGLVANSTASHIHAPGDATIAANVVFDFSKNGTVQFTAGPTAQTYSGTILMTAATPITTAINGDSLRKLMDAGLTYVNVHSTTYPAGEIRGQIAKQ